MKDVLYLAWRYLSFHRVKTTILVSSIALIVYLPVGLNVLVGESARELTARAEATPLLVGAKGSPLELVLNSLYFESDPPAVTPYAEAIRIEQGGLARAIPLHNRFHSRNLPIVGTTLDYFDFRHAEIAEGRRMAVLGECVVGTSAASELGVELGGAVISSPDTVFDLAGVYPLKMKVVGILQPTFSPDDRAIFVDLKTAWIIEGLGHGHQDLAQADAAATVLSQDEANIVANASVVQYNEITPRNIDSFHFHGDLSGYPLTAIVAVPGDEKSGTILMGRYEGADEASQIVRPTAVMEELLDTVLTIQSFVIAAVLLVALATLATASLVFLLSLRLRRKEIETMMKIGASRFRVVAVLVSEVAVVLIVGATVAGGLAALTRALGSMVTRAFLIDV